MTGLPTGLPNSVRLILAHKQKTSGRLRFLQLAHGTLEELQADIQRCLNEGAPGGGYVLSDNHGEIPWQVPDEILLAITDAVHTWGRYPLDWIRQEGAV